MNASRATTIRSLPVFLAFIFNLVIGPALPFAQQAITRAANDGIDSYQQCQIGNPNAGADCDSWINGILNATHNNYTEDEVVPQRLVMTFDSPGLHSVDITYLTRKDSGTQHHAYDYLATWNYTYTNADRLLGLNAADQVGGGPATLPIPSDPNSVSPGGPQPTSAHELPQADRQFVLYGGNFVGGGASTPTHSTDPAEAGSDYGTITVTFNVTAADNQIMLLFGGHLAAGNGDRGWGSGLGAADISGGPYHIRITASDGESIGNRDNQIMSNAIAPLLPSLEIDKTADAASVNAGENIGFTITVTNNGPGIAQSATLNDPLPAGSGVNWEISPAYAGQGSCAITGNPPTETLTCAFGNMAAGASASVHVQSATTANSCGEYPNTATADADNFDAVQATALTTVNCPNLAISKTTSTPTVYAGGIAKYTITVNNTGAGAATGVVINDTLPAGLTWVENPDSSDCTISGGSSLSCGPLTIAAGGSFSVTVQGTTDAGDCPSILNRATFTSGNDGSGASHPQGEGAQVTVLCPDVSVSKSGNGPITAGDTATWTIVVSAGGSGTSQNVQLDDDLPAGVSWSLGNANDEAACSINTAVDPDHLHCAFGDMAAGSSKTVVLNGVTDAGECPAIVNGASVSATVDVDGSNNSSTAYITVNCGDIQLTKSPDQPTDNGGTVNAGEVATFTFGVHNDGDGIARGVTLDDTLPATASGWNLGSSNDEADCTLVDNDLSCDFGDLASQASRTVQVWTTTTLDDCGNLVNLNALADTTNDGQATDDGAILVTCPDLAMTKSTDTTVVTAGDEVHYTISVDNTGDGDATGVLISDSLPSGITWTETSDDCSISGGTSLSCGPLTIAAGGSFSVTVTGTTDAGDCPSILNRSTYTSDNAGSGASHPVGQGVQITINCPDVGVAKTADKTPINAGDDAGYTVTVTAGGTGTSTNVTLHDDLPPVDGAWSYQIASPDADDTCSIVANDLDCSFGDMTPGQQKVVTVSHATTADDCGTLLNDAFVDADVNVDAQNDSVLDVPIVVNCPDIVVEKTGSGTVNATDAIYFEITVRNTGDGDAYDVELNDTLPSVANGWTLADGPDFCELNGVALSCATDALASGASFTVRLEADSAPADCGDLDNLASAEASNEASGDTANNEDDHTIVVACPDLTASKEADDEVVSAGQPIGFTITVTNSDASGTGTAYDVMIHDPLPAGSGLDWSIDPANAACAISGEVGAESLDCDFGDMAAGAEQSVHVVSATGAADCATYPNVADVTATNHATLNPSDDTTVECPGLNISKLADNGTIDAGEIAAYTVVIWNSGPGTALNASFSDELPAGVSWGIQLLNPDGDDACMSSIDSAGNQSVSCTFGDLAPSSMENGKQIRISGLTSREDCGILDNTAFADADNDDQVQSSASITVKCPTIGLEKVNNQAEPVLPGTVISYTLTLTVSDGPAKAVVVTDALPLGLDAPTSISDGGTYEGGTRLITWNLGDLADGSYTLTYQAAVSAGDAHGDVLVNVAVATSPNSQCPDAENAADECDDESDVTVRVPELVIDKAADADEVHFVFDPDGNVLSVDPEIVTWTLTYTLTNGPVTNAVITDPLPAFLVFVSASDAGTYADGVITWELGTLSESGSVSFQTSVDPAAPEVEPIVNVATIVSDQTAPDDGQDEIIVTSESELGGNPTPSPSVPDTAALVGAGGMPISIPVGLVVIVFIGSLGALAFANVREVRRRR